MGFLKLFASKGPKIEFVASGHSPRLALDAGGTPWIAYFHGGVFLAHPDLKGKWQVQRIDEAYGLIGSPPAVSVDAGGGVHIAYCDMSRRMENANRSILGYATVKDGVVSLQVLDSGKPNCCGVYPSLAISPSSRMVISYHYDEWGDFKLDEEVIRVAEQEGGDWKMRIVEGSAPGGHGSALAFDPAGCLHIAFNQRTSTGAVYTGPIFHAVEKEGSFEVSRLDGHECERPALAVDQKGIPHISYVFEVGNGSRERRLGYATLLNGAWQVTDLGPAESTFGRVTSIAIDQGGSPLIAFIHRGALMLGSFKGGAWVQEKLWEWKSRSKDDRFYPGYCVCMNLVIDAGGSRVLCFQSSTSSHKDDIYLMRL